MLPEGLEYVFFLCNKTYWTPVISDIVVNAGATQPLPGDQEHGTQRFLDGRE